MRTAVFDPFLYKHSPPPFTLKPVAHGAKKIAEDDKVPFIERKDTLIGASDPLNYVCLGESILGSFTLTPNFIGQINAETGEKVTYKEMRDKSVKLALGLQILGITKSSVITICTRNHMLAYLPLLAGIYLNTLVNMWDAEYLDDYLRSLCFLLENNPDVIFIDEENFVKIKHAITFLHSSGKVFSITIIILDRPHEEYPSVDSIVEGKFEDSIVDNFTCTVNRGTAAAVQMYSSNATGYPGYARIPYQAFLSPSNNQTPVMKRGDVGLWYGPINWTHNLLLTIRAILGDVTVVKSSRACSEKNLCQIVDKYKVNWVFLESNMCDKLSNIHNFKIFNKYDVSSLKTVLFGDAEIRKEVHKNLMRRLRNASIIKVYALSEAGIIAYQRSSNKIGSSGYVSKNVELMIVHSVTRKQLGKNIPGEIWCKTPCIIQFSNSVRNHDADTKRINEGWYYTEDIGYFDKDGDIYVIGNSRDVVKCRNVFLSLIKIEKTLQLHPAVSDAAAVAVKIGAENHPKALIVKKPNAEVTKTELVEFVMDTLMDDNYKLRGGVDFINKIPYLPNGKVDRIRAKAMSRVSDNE